ncbi:dipeptidyl aminopeptidase/acylaminoacyl peptidase [Brevundimonas nasdae]|uniref:alpha/beta hydrolase family protein n=1 Tax=Brevundimonas nasdae TaxID=172043 RepID=UPI001913E4D5|nr:S9 family peptidase [Brevundimonas nasdae]MBK6025524.1 S9 family peptidase [Brevundimonas nasdae]MDQ0452154.1 dipeptidyl aminopeptidase/acylaminoacyl peptidase [Brevundimonas nasdae]
MFRSWVNAAAMAAVIVLSGAAGGAQGQTAPQVTSQTPPLSAYGAAPSIENIELSPSGDRIARITVVGEERAVLVSDFNTGEALFRARIGDTKVRDLTWIGEKRILVVTCQTRGIPLIGIPRTELYFGLIVDLEKRKMVQVLDRTENVISVLYGPAMVRRVDQDAALYVRGVAVGWESSSDLYRIDLTTGRGRSVAPMNYEIKDHVLDGGGQVIAMGKYVERRGRWTLMLPRANRSSFREDWSVDTPIDTPDLMGMGRSPRTIVISAMRPDLAGTTGASENGYTLFEVNVDTGEWSRLPFDTHPDFMIRHPMTRLLIGAGWVEEDGVHYEFIEPVSAQRWASIERAFAGKRPKLVSWNDDMDQVIIFTDVGESGLYQIVDFQRGKADILAEAYPAIPDDQVGAIRVIEYEAADGLAIPGYLTLPPGVTEPKGLPLVVLPHGGPAAQDTIGFDWWSQALASRGYAVLQPNFRGSTGYGLDFMEAGYGEWGRKMQTDLSDGVRWLAAQGVIDPSRVCIVGASYGGYAAMAGVTIDKGVYRCAVAVAGLSDLRRFVNWSARQESRADSQTIRYWNRFMGVDKLNDRGLDALSPAHLAAGVDSPLLLIHGRDDTVVPIEQSRVMADAMRRAGKPTELIELSGEDHWLSRAETRQKMLAETVRFLEVNNPVH